jgi:hypothetical protein
MIERIKSFIDRAGTLVDIKSGVIVGLWSLTILAGCLFSIKKTGSVSTGVAMCFSSVIGGLAATNISKNIGGPKNDA